MKEKVHFDKVAYLVLLPALLLYTGFLIGPALSSIYYSLTSWDGLSPQMKFIGLDNFAMMFQDPRFFNALKNTLLLTAVVTVAENLLALLLAVLVDRVKYFKSLLRSAFYIPVLLSGIIVGFIWTIMYNYNFGVINSLLAAWHLEFLKVDWLGRPESALFSIMLTLTWQWAGYYMVIYLAALQGVPQELTEAARIDGANRFQQFWRITYPMLAGAVTINLTLALIQGLKVFDQIAVMTDGGPGFASETLTYIIYKVAFADFKQGYGTAIAIVLFVLILILATIQINILRQREIEL
jgi:multiple sugar transport system permease protein/raffinose/stachyose/melibiose transport system permease protein